MCAEAAASYRRAIELNPTLVEPHANLYNALLDLQQFEDAHAAAARAAQLRPDVIRFALSRCSKS